MIADRVARRFLMVQRLADRFAAVRPLKPEKLRELLMKLRKGSGTSLKVSDLLRVLDGIGGWKVEREPFLAYEPYYLREDEVHWVGDDSEAHVQSLWERAKATEVGALPAHPQVDKVYTMDVSPIEAAGNRFRFSVRTWRGTWGLKFTSPAHQEFLAKLPPDQVEKAFPSNVRGVGTSDTLWKWLMGGSKFLDQVNAFLGTESVDTERERLKRKPRTMDNTGTCSCCFGVFKLTPTSKEGKDRSMPGMALHGYKRPGLGYIHGNCFGMDWPPYELSVEGTVAWAKVMTDVLARENALLERYKKGEVTEVLDYAGKTQSKQDLPPHAWETLLTNATERQEGKVFLVQKDLDRLRGAISDWRPPVNQ